MINYQFLGTHGDRRSAVLTDDVAYRRIGERVMCGFDVVTRFVNTPDNSTVLVTYFASDFTGHVWAIYYDQI